mgnify:CR=1 FL=1
MDRLETLSIVVPCYNEEAMVVELVEHLDMVLSKLTGEGLVGEDSHIVLVDDGSTDQTWPLICSSCETYKRVNGVKLSGNVGHQNALMAGLTVAKDTSDLIVSLDADLQDDTSVISEMIKLSRQGNDVVYGVRKDRTSDSLAKRETAQIFYKTMKVLGVRTVYNHADYRLMTKKAVEYLSEFNERNLYLRGLVPLLGCKSATVEYKREERREGKSKYSIRKMLHLAMDGITSFTDVPVHIVLWLGVAFLAVSFGILVYVMVSYFIHSVVPGWSSLMLSIWFCSGCVLTSLGVIGEYIGKIYVEVKGRPRYRIEKKSGEKVCNIPPTIQKAQRGEDDGEV